MCFTVSASEMTTPEHASGVGIVSDLTWINALRPPPLKLPKLMRGVGECKVRQPSGTSGLKGSS
jgi:hypothetical protein